MAAWKGVYTGSQAVRCKVRKFSVMTTEASRDPGVSGARVMGKDLGLKNVGTNVTWR